MTRAVLTRLLEYKHSHLKRYFKEGRGLRSELTINNPKDFGLLEGLDHLPALRALGDRGQPHPPRSRTRQSPLQLGDRYVDRPQGPLTLPGSRVSALRFGDPRVMALLQALCGFAHLTTGFRNRDLRPRVPALLGRSYSSAQMTYDLRELRLRGLIERRPGTHAYTITRDGLALAFFYSKLYLRIPSTQLGSTYAGTPLRTATPSRRDRTAQPRHHPHPREAALAA